MFSEAIIIAGGKGTRLSPVVSNRAKSMVEIGDKPFISLLLERLNSFGVKRVVLAVGYLHEQIVSFYGSRYKEIELSYSIEQEPLGTGGAIVKALKQVESNNILVLNGDTLFDIDLDYFHKKTMTLSSAEIILALKHVDDVNQFGSVALGKNSEIISFNEKGTQGKGLINGGIYAVKASPLIQKAPSNKFSFEHEYLMNNEYGLVKKGVIFSDHFIDIGTPSRLAMARKTLI